jgi:hypothetical protein
MKSSYNLISKKYRGEESMGLEGGIDLDKGLPSNAGNKSHIILAKQSTIDVNIRMGKS